MCACVWLIEDWIMSEVKSLRFELMLPINFYLFINKKIRQLAKPLITCAQKANKYLTFIEKSKWIPNVNKLHQTNSSVHIKVIKLPLNKIKSPCSKLKNTALIQLNNKITSTILLLKIKFKKLCKENLQFRQLKFHSLYQYE